MDLYYWAQTRLLLPLERPAQPSKFLIHAAGNDVLQTPYSLSETLLEISSRLFAINFVVFLYLPQHFISRLLLSNVNILSTLREVPLGFPYFYLITVIPVPLTFVFWELRTYLDVRH